MIKELDEFIIRNIENTSRGSFEVTYEKVENFNYSTTTKSLIQYKNSKDAQNNLTILPNSAINSPFELKKNTVKEINIFPLSTSIIKITEQVEKIPQMLFFNISIVYSNSSLNFNSNSKTKPGKLEKIKNNQIVDLPVLFFIRVKEYIFECETSISYDVIQPEFMITFSKIMNTFIENVQNSQVMTTNNIPDNFFDEVVLDESNFLGFGIKHEIVSYFNNSPIPKIYNAELTLSYPEDKNPLEEIKDWKYIEKIKIDTVKLFQDFSKVFLFSFNEDIKEYLEVQTFIKNILEFHHMVNDINNIEVFDTGKQRTFNTVSDILKNTNSGNTKIILIFSHEITIDSNTAMYFELVFNQDENKLVYVPLNKSSINNIKTLNKFTTFSKTDLIFPSQNIQSVSVLNAFTSTIQQKKLQLINNYFITKEIIEIANNEINSGGDDVFKTHYSTYGINTIYVSSIAE